VTVGQFFESRASHNRVQIFGDLRLNSLPRLISTLHQLVAKAGYPDVVLDFSSLSSITHSVIPPLAAHLRWLVRDKKVEFEYLPPRQQHVAVRLIKLGLAHYVEHRRFPKPRLNSSDPSVLQFLDQDEREVAVDKVIKSALRKTDLSRANIAALEWAVNEITDNVITHSNSAVGGFLICQKLSHYNILEFTVADAGIGVARSLGIQDECEAVERAIQEGVTRNKSTNQGNGLYGTYQLALASSGIFVLNSAHANLYVTKSGEMHIRDETIPYRGTYVVSQIDCSNAQLIEQALTIGGKSHSLPFDYIERTHESETGKLKVQANELCHTFGSRQSGIEARKYISNLLRTDEALQLEIDFAEVFVISSSFADEVFGKLFVEMGPLRYMRRVSLLNVAPAVEGLIDRAITLRSQTGL
jgi:anti-sigma regulatory factor (Ser/Thr protein kinase)/anti-anti-sigma regulatory factor